MSSMWVRVVRVTWMALQLYRQNSATVTHGPGVTPLINTVNLYIHQEKSMLNPHTFITLCDKPSKAAWKILSNYNSSLDVHESHTDQSPI